ncbi:MAG: outer membrane lipoprotein carrier protein LolA [Pseudomonadota bacterium]
MFSIPMTALVAALAFGQPALTVFQAPETIPSEEEIVDPATVTPAEIAPPVLEVVDEGQSQVSQDTVKNEAEARAKANEFVPDFEADQSPLRSDELPAPAIEGAQTLDPELAQASDPASSDTSDALAAAPVAEPPAELDPLSSEGRALLQSVADAMSKARTARGRFAQFNADGTQSEGDFALSRPGKMRFDYAEPTPVLIVADGATVALQDRALETIDRIPLATTPLGMILSERLSFTDDIDVLAIAKAENRIAITVEDATGEMDGQLTMVFTDPAYDLVGWYTLDADYQVTRVSLSDLETNIRIDPRQFILRDEEDEEDER